jgi:hypothetical protein
MATTSRGALIALAIGGGAAALAVIVTVIVAIRFVTKDTGTTPESVTDQGAEVGREGMRAKGTAELRVLGCDQAIVIDMVRLLHDASAVRDGEPRYIVTCDVLDAGGPSCERAAATYFAALGRTDDGAVNIRIAPRGSRQPTCSRLYGPSGVDLGVFPRVR